jgi:hypothetical protein
LEGRAGGIGDVADRPTRTLLTGDPKGDRVTRSQSDDLAAALRCPLLLGQQLKRVTLKPNASGPTQVNHGLGRQLLGWFVVRVGGVPPFLYPTEISANARLLTLLNPSAIEAVMDLWVY